MHAQSTVLCPKILGGIVARSPRRNCWIIKMMIRRPNPKIQPQTFESFHGYFEPPHCSASRRHTIAQIRNTAPTRSISRIFSLVVKPLDFRSGGLKKRKTVASAIAPKGKLICQINIASIGLDQWCVLPKSTISRSTCP